MDQSWRERAACRGMGHELFLVAGHAGRGLTGAQLDQVAAAKRVCAGCVVRSACLRFALAAGERFGVWGGEYLSERTLPRLRAEARRDAGGPDVAA